ncbi:MAG TPA: SRPBCC family protein [Gaiellaceae bacterium]|jgi:uncharacterized protein YndB with AHSA1/START domain
MSEPGVLRKDGERRGLRFERFLAAPPDEVWSALTDPERLARWLAPASIELRPGGAVSIDFGEGQAVVGMVLACEPPLLLEYEWRFSGEGESIVRFELSAHGDGTALLLDHRLLGAEQATGYGAGWHAHLDLLGDELTGRSGPGWDERFEQLLPAYRERAAHLQ